FETLREFRIPVTLRELLDLQGALSKHLVYANIDEFYLLSRAVMVKDEKYYDRFDQAFGNFFEGLAYVPPEWFSQAIPEDWLRKQVEKNLSAEELAKLKKRGSLEELM